jgi:hypothetical protein
MYVEKHSVQNNMARLVRERCPPSTARTGGRVVVINRSGKIAIYEDLRRPVCVEFRLPKYRGFQFGILVNAQAQSLNDTLNVDGWSFESREFPQSVQLSFHRGFDIRRGEPQSLGSVFSAVKSRPL